MKISIRAWANLITLLIALFGVLAQSPLLMLYAPYILLVLALLNVTLSWLHESFPDSTIVKYLVR